MRYRLNGQHMSDVAVLPSVVADYLRLASETQLKVLLWAATDGKAGGTAAECAAALGARVSEAACADAFRFWEAEGILIAADGEASPRKAATASAAAVAAPTPAPVVLPTPRPAPVKPQLTEVISRQRACPELTFLLTEASARMGKPLSPSDQQTVLYLYDTVGLPAEVILMVVAYAVGAGKGNMHYIEKTAIDWADRDIRTVPAANEFLCALDRREKAWTALSQMLTLPPRPNTTHKELAVKWLLEWKLSQELLQFAADYCIERNGKFKYNYIDAVLEAWRADGLDTPDKVRKASAPQKKKSAVKAPSADGGFDVTKYEEMVRSHTPKYRKKGQE